MSEQEAKEAAIEKAAKEIFQRHPDVPCWVPATHHETFTRMFAYIARLGLDAGWQSAMDYSQSDGEVEKKVTPWPEMDLGYAPDATSTDTELSTLKEQLRLTNEMLAATHAIELRVEHVDPLYYRLVQGVNGKWLNVGDSGIETYDSALEAYAAIKPVQQGD